MSKIGFVSLGCDKNTVDTEKILHLLMSNGHEIVTDESLADIIIINTCAFIKDAKEESINTIIEMGHYKEEGNCKFIITCGCLGERYKEDLLKLMPEVDAICGVHAYEKINDVIDRLLNGEKDIIEICASPIDTITSRVITTTGHYEYLKIAEGCNNHCTYCAIPLIRGKYKSRPYEDIIEEAKKLAKDGVKELIIVAQETTCYGIDLYGKYRLHELISDICKIEELKWIRLLYCYPENITDELIDVIAKEDKVCKYIDMPIQHLNDKILKTMGRNTNQKEVLSKIDKLREKIPNIIIRSTLIVGFPGETKAEFDDLRQAVKNVKIDRLGVFDYSKEEGTPAEKLKGQVRSDVKLKRKDEIMGIAECIVNEKSLNYVGKTFEVIVDGFINEDDIYCGRTYMDSPNIDGIVFFKSEKKLMAGDFVYVKIDESLGYDLCGKEVEKNEFTK